MNLTESGTRGIKYSILQTDISRSLSCTLQALLLHGVTQSLPDLPTCKNVKPPRKRYNGMVLSYKYLNGKP